MWRFEILLIIVLAVAIAGFAVTGQPKDAIHAITVGAVVFFAARWVPGRIGFYLRKLLLRAPEDPIARLWHVSNDEQADYRQERSWDDTNHRWVYRYIYFNEEEEAVREVQGRTSYDSRQW